MLNTYGQSLRIVSALFVDLRKGPYGAMPGVDCWDIARDATQYCGPYPVVAHPPCEQWSMLANLNQALYGNPIKQDGGLFLAALKSVRTFGGVLEHPAYSMAWAEYGLPAAGTHSVDNYGGYTITVDQCLFGHVAIKRTWLYIVGLDRDSLPAMPENADLGSRRMVTTMANKTKHISPKPFADWLVAIARLSKR